MKTTPSPGSSEMTSSAILQGLDCRASMDRKEVDRKEVDRKDCPFPVVFEG